MAAVWLTLRVVPESRGARGRRIDWAGTVTFVAFAGALTCGAVRAGSHGWGATGTLVWFTGAALAPACFLVVERRVQRGGVRCHGVHLDLVADPARDERGARRGRLLWPSLASFVVAAAGGRRLHGVSVRLTIGGGLLLIGAGQYCMAVLDAGSTAKP